VNITSTPAKRRVRASRGGRTIGRVIMAIPPGGRVRRDGGRKHSTAVRELTYPLALRKKVAGKRNSGRGGTYGEKERESERRVVA